MAIEHPHYQETRDALMKDPVILQMTAEVSDAYALAVLSEGKDPNTGNDFSPTAWMMLCLRVYHERGGKLDTHIGGPGEAIKALLERRHNS